MLKASFRSVMAPFGLAILAAIVAGRAAVASDQLTVVVTANPIWTDTGLAVATTDVVQIYGATGAWRTQSAYPYDGPDGSTHCQYVWDEWWTDARHGRLIGYVGPNPNLVAQDDPNIFVVGTNSVTFAGRAGELWLGFNDAFATRFPNGMGLGDNSGSVTVQVSRATTLPNLGIALDGSDIQLTLSTISTDLFQYAVQSTTDLLTAAWSTISSNLIVTGNVVSAFDLVVTPESQRFYRLGMSPLPRSGSDNAANAAYGCGWVMFPAYWNGTNYNVGLTDGTGFGQWKLTATAVIGGYSNGFYIGSSTNNAFGASPGIDTVGRAWGMYANDNNLTAAYRSFASGPLAIGGTFRIDMDNGFIISNSSVGVVLRTGNASDSPFDYTTGARFTFLFLGGDSVDSYKVIDAAGMQNIGVPFTGTGLRLVFTLDTPDTYTLLTINNASQATNTFSGTLAGSGSLDSIALFNNNSGTGPYYDCFFNSLAIMAGPTPPSFTITTGSAPAGGGTTSGGGIVDYGSTVTVCATANTCYGFVNWTDPGSNVVSTLACYSFTVTTNVSLTANFAPVTYAIAASVAPAGGGTTSGGGTVDCGSNVTLCATANDCYSFVNWTDVSSNVVSTSNCYDVVASTNVSVTANFTPITYTVATDAAPSGGGTTSGGGTVDCGSNVTVCAVVSTCYSFADWTDASNNVVSTSACYEFIASTNVVLTANFIPVNYAITTDVEPAGAGTASGGGTVLCGSNVTVCAAADACYNFVSWTDPASNVVSTSACYSFAADTNASLIANFAPITYTVTADVASTGGGSVSGGGVVVCGSNVTLCATASNCDSFVSWTDESSNVVSTLACYNFTATTNVSLTANFAPITYAITTGAEPVAGGTTSGGGTVLCGSNVTVCATATNCYSFVNWIDESSNVVSTLACYSFTANTNVSLTANFAPITYTINTSALPSGGGTTSGGGMVLCGSNVTVCASASNCYSFVDWTDASNNVVSTSACYDFVASTDVNLIAHFAPITYSITADVAPAGGGATSGSGVVVCGSNVTLCATANACYGFVNWTDLSSNVVSTSACFSFAASTNVSVVANFVPLSFAITTSAAPVGGGTTSGGGTVLCGSNVTVCAAANANYSFVNWTDPSSNVVSTLACYSFTANTNTSLVANFALVMYTIGANAAPTNGGTTSGGGTVASGSNVTVCATANPCYNFVNWTDQSSNVVSTTNCYGFTASTNTSLVANFAPITYTINTSALPAGSGTTGGGGTVACGSNVTVCAAGNACYNFVNWTDPNSNVVSTSACYNFTAASNQVLIANFSGGQGTQAVDNAVDPIYAVGLYTSFNGGIGFGGWTLTSSGVNGSTSNGFFVASSTNNAAGTAPGIDTSGKAWGIYANAGNTAAAYRAFTWGALPIGGKFRIDMDSGFVDSNSVIGFALRNSNASSSPTNYSTNARFQFLYRGGDVSNSYKVADQAGTQNIGVPFTGTGLHLVFTLTGTNSYTLLTIDNASNTTNTYSGTLAGSGSLDSIALFNVNAGKSPAGDLFFNSLLVSCP